MSYGALSKAPRSAHYRPAGAPIGKPPTQRPLEQKQCACCRALFSRYRSKTGKLEHSIVWNQRRACSRACTYHLKNGTPHDGPARIIATEAGITAALRRAREG